MGEGRRVHLPVGVLRRRAWVGALGVVWVQGVDHWGVIISRSRLGNEMNGGVGWFGAASGWVRAEKRSVLARGVECCSSSGGRRSSGVSAHQRRAVRRDGGDVLFERSNLPGLDQLDRGELVPEQASDDVVEGLGSAEDVLKEKSREG